MIVDSTCISLLIAKSVDAIMESERIVVPCHLSTSWIVCAFIDI